MITSLLAPNPGPMTLEGTRTYLVPGVDGTLVIDPGPDIDAHLDAIADACPHGVTEIWLTHHHLDHSEAAPRLSERYRVPVRAADASLCIDAAPLADAERQRVGEHDVDVVALPGHTRDSLGFVVGDALIAGDTLLGRGTTVIVHPDGDLADYLASLNRVRELLQDRVRRILPAHGPDIIEPGRVVEEYLAHRHERLVQVQDALARGATSAAEVVDMVYADVPDAVRFAAEMSVEAQLTYLRGRDA